MVNQFAFQAVEGIQSAKKQFVSTFVQNKTAAKAMNEFIDAQADYTKKAVAVGMDTFTVLSAEMVKSAQNASKFDYTKFGEGIMKAYSEINKSTEKTK